MNVFHGIPIMTKFDDWLTQEPLMPKEIVCRRCGTDTFVGQPCDGTVCKECGATDGDIQEMCSGDIMCHGCGFTVGSGDWDAFTCGETNEFIPDDDYDPTDKYEDDKLF